MTGQPIWSLQYCPRIADAPAEPVACRGGKDRKTALSAVSVPAEFAGMPQYLRKIARLSL
jgi:hypothetical protein